jgi:hypothetical protein
MSRAGAGETRRPLLSRIRVVHALPLVPLFLVALFASGPIGDNSFLWHVRAGAEQFDAGRVLTSDVFSFTEIGSAWRTQSWLAELLYNGMDSVSPDSLVWASWLALFGALLTLLFVGIAVYRSTPSPLTTGLALVAAVWLIGPFVQPRPVIFSFVFLAALVVVLQNKDRVLWLVVPIIWIWAAFHGSWVIGGLLIVLEWGRTGDRRIFNAGIAALLSSLATAHGFGTWIVVADFLGAREALALMSEWRVPNFGSPAQMPYLLVILGVVVAAVRGKLTMRDLIVVVPFMFLGMTARRTVVPATIVLASWAALAIPPFKVPRSDSSPVLAGIVVAAIAVLGLTPMLKAEGELDAVRFPSDDVVERLNGTNPFYDDGVGGFLIYEQWPDRLVWIDDRAELHGAERLSELRRAVEGQYEDVFDRYGFDAALTKPDWALTDRLKADGWVVDYETDEFLVLLP